MNRIFLALIACLFVLPAYNQVPDEIPQDYSRQYRRVAKQVGSHPDSVYLAPIEQVPIAPSITSQSTGNYAERFFGLDESAKQWVKDNIKRRVWVLIFDTAGQLSHVAVNPFSDPALNGTYTGEPPFDGHGHGTHVASCVAGIHPNGLPMGPASVLGDFLKMGAVKVLSNGGSGSINNITRATKEKTAQMRPYIERGDAVIFNYSLGGGGSSTPLTQAMKEAEAAGIYVIAAAGNTGREPVQLPANIKHVHAIAAVNSQGQRASFSTIGDDVYMAAPGVRVFGAWPKSNSGYAELNGTSMASPSHCAIAAIALATSRANASQVSHFFADKAKDLPPTGWDKYTGFGHGIMQAIIEGGIEDYPRTGNGNPTEDDTDNPDNPDEPDAPTDEDSPHGRRDFIIESQGPYSVLWGTPTRGWVKDSVKLVVTWKSKKWQSKAVSDAVKATDKFFTNRGFGLSDRDDEAEMAYWVRHFYEMLADRDYDAIALAEVWYKEGTEWVKLDRARKKTTAKIKRLFKPEIKVLEFTPELD